MGDNPTDENRDDTSVDVNLSDSTETGVEDEDDGFEHPEDVPTTDMSEIPEVNSAEDVVDGDEDRMERLKNKAEEMKEENDEAEAEDEGREETVPDKVAEDGDGTPVDLGDEVPEHSEDRVDPLAQDGGAVTETPDSDSVEQASSSVFTDEEAEEVEEEFGDQFELETLDDIPDDFDYEDQDTSHYGGQEEANIKHNGVVFKLAQPSGAKEDKFWSEIQTKSNLAGMFDVMIKYAVERPKDIEERMEEENWTGFAKAGLAMKISSFLGLDALQDF